MPKIDYSSNGPWAIAKKKVGMIMPTHMCLSWKFGEDWSSKLWHNWSPREWCPFLSSAALDQEGWGWVVIVRHLGLRFQFHWVHRHSWLDSRKSLRPIETCVTCFQGFCSRTVEENQVDWLTQLHPVNGRWNGDWKALNYCIVVNYMCRSTLTRLTIPELQCQWRSLWNVVADLVAAYCWSTE